MIKNTVVLFSYVAYTVQYIVGMSGCDQKVPLHNLPPSLPGVREVEV